MRRAPAFLAAFSSCSEACGPAISITRKLIMTETCWPEAFNRDCPVRKTAISMRKASACLPSASARRACSAIIRLSLVNAPTKGLRTLPTHCTCDWKRVILRARFVVRSARSASSAYDSKRGLREPATYSFAAESRRPSAASTHACA